MAKPDPVVVIGAGPVGLCLALALAQQEVSVTLIEAMSDDNFLDQVPRAGSNHPTTLEFFDRIGLYAKMEPRGLIAPKFQYWDRQGNALIAEFDHALLKNDTRFLCCNASASKSSRRRWRWPRRTPGDGAHGHRRRHEQTADGVTARYHAANEPETIAGAFIVSAGRRAASCAGPDVVFEGFTYPERTLNIRSPTISASTATPSASISDRSVLQPVPLKGPLTAGASTPTDPNEDETALTRPEALQTRLKRFLPLDRDFDICGCNLYAVHQRVAQKFRVGRAILAGDAAHVNSPIGGMGLNSGVHDAFNLADKLARILRREADETELDHYERQRRHIAVTHTQAQTIRNKRLLEERDPAVHRRNHDELRRSAEDPALARKFLMRTALFDSLREAEAVA